MKRHLHGRAIVLALTLAAWTLAAATPSWVQGVVTLRESDKSRPFPGVIVSLRSAAGVVLASTMTDREGRYQFADLPRQRVIVAADRVGYYTERAAGRADSHLTFDCVLECREAGANLELVRGAAVSGSVVDETGEPIERAQVRLRRSDSSSSYRFLARDKTDDRGAYRLAGLRPGDYVVSVRGQTPGGVQAHHTAEVTVGESEKLEGFNLVLGRDGAYPVSGRVSGIPLGDENRARLFLRSIGGLGSSITVGIAADGGFRIDSIPAGRYAASAIARDEETYEAGRVVLEYLNVQGAIDGVLLQPLEPARVSGTVESAAGDLPGRAVIRIASNEGLGRRWSALRGEDHSFEIDDLVPGLYRVEAHSRGFYVKGVDRGGGLESGRELMLSPGETHLKVIAAADFGRVRGTVRGAASGGVAPLARVALERDGEKLLAQADQTGRFSFGEVIPGEYRICAWADIAPQGVDDEANWRRAGCEFKIITLDAESDIEIDLQAAE